MTGAKSPICACGNHASRRTGDGFICDRCWNIEHAVKRARTRERQFESDERHVVRDISPYLYYEVQRQAAVFWAKRGICEPVEQFNACERGAMS